MKEPSIKLGPFSYKRNMKTKGGKEMAIYEKETIDGIQLANGLDYCCKCHRPGSTIPSDYSIEYDEVFKLHFNGLSYCLCMDHLQELLGEYKIVHANALSQDTINIPLDLVKNGTTDEILEFVEKAAK